MSVPEPAAKRQRVDGEEEEEERDDGLVIVSNFGDVRPEEIVPDTVATYFLDGGMSVRSYVVVVDFGKWPIYLANWEREGALKSYVKKMIPKTKYLRGITCDVMMLLCHGMSKYTDSKGNHRPHSMCFYEPCSVGTDGEHRGYTPRDSQVWSCSGYTDGEKTYKKVEDGITLSEVVCGSRLVLLTCCIGGPIMREYRKEMGEKERPDFVYFAMDENVHDISINIFLALLIDALERAKERGGTWTEFIRRCVCQVLVWVKGCGDSEDRLWDFLELMDYVDMRGENGKMFRIKGCIHNFSVEADDKQTVLRELQSLTLLLWDGGEGGARVERIVNHETDKDELAALTGGKPFRRGSQGASAESPITVDGLLLQLKGLLRDG
jgi:hypothetical protein